MNKREIIDLLELEELEFAVTLIGQVQDNLDELTIESKNARETKNIEDLLMLAYNTERLNNRHEILLNLLRNQVESANEKIGKALKELFNLEEVDSE